MLLLLDYPQRLSRLHANLIPTTVVKGMLDPAALAAFRENVAAQENRAVFEIPEILAKLLDASSTAAERGRETGDSEIALRAR